MKLRTAITILCSRNFFWFCLLVIMLGLLQLWMTALTMFMMGRFETLQSWDNIDNMFADGSLFFYSTALVGGSAYTLISNEAAIRNKRLRDWIMAISVLVIIVTVQAYTEDLSIYLTQNHHNPLHRYFMIQLLCLGIALVVAFVVMLLFESHASAERAIDEDSDRRKIGDNFV